jgi:hypothetical protein
LLVVTPIEEKPNFVKIGFLKVEKNLRISNLFLLDVYDSDARGVGFSQTDPFLGFTHQAVETILYDIFFQLKLPK